MDRYLSYFLIISLIVFLSCGKDERGVNPPSQPKKVSFSVEASAPLQTFEYKFNNSNNTEVLYGDTLVMDSTFYLTRPSIQNSYDDVLTVNLNLRTANAIVNDVKWKVGSETSFREGKSIILEFRNPVGVLNVKCYFSYDTAISSSQVVRVYDTITKKINIRSLDSYNFSYLGYDKENPSDTFRVQLQYAPEPLIPAMQNQPYYNLKGLPRKYPYAVSIIPNGLLFGSYETVNYYQLPRYVISDGYYYSNWFGNGFYKASFDSVYIKYSYVKQQGIIRDSSTRTVNRTFVGKRVP